MYKFWLAPLSLTQDTIIQAKVTAVNNRGISEVSNQSTSIVVKVETIPFKMTTLENGIYTTHQQIYLTWIA